ncbi:MAG: sigma-70 family RNA polymerase sigma factor, partial [Planctomycetota bacterium]
EFRGDSDIDTWLYGIARFTILARIRRLRNRDWCEVDVEGAPAPSTPERSPGTLADTGIVRVVSDCLDDAGTTVAEIFRRRILMEMSFVRISKDLNVKEANVKARYYRSLPRLRRSLGRLWSDLGRG